MPTLLILGGTGEARQLAARVTGTPGLAVISSLAGRVERPAMPVGATRTGGFGGVDGLAGWLRAHAPAVVVDATHPFAENITAHAVAACAATGVDLLRLQRPAWSPRDSWHPVATTEAAAEALPMLGNRPFLTTGRGGLDRFLARPVTAVVRCVDPPEKPLPDGWQLILDRGPYTVDSELALMRGHAIDVLVTKNSGGDLTGAKLQAAEELGLPVLVIDRPLLPVGLETVATVEAAETWLRRRLA